MRYAGLLALGFALTTAIASAQTTDNQLAKARVFDYDQMKARITSNGSDTRVLFSGTLATGESVGAHETMQPVGTVPPKLHKIEHSEFIVVVQGTLEFEHDGITERAGPGSVIYVALDTEHAAKNVGDGPAKYVVLQVGGDTKK